MKSKLKGVMGIGFALVLVASLMLFAIPTAAGPYEDLEPPLPNMWTGFQPQPGLLGNWFFDPGIEQVGPLAQAINGDLYAHVAGATANGNDIFKSTDNGRTWSVSTVPAYYTGGAVVDMVCSSKSEDVIYLTDGNYVYKSINGGVSFTLVAQSDLENQLMGVCGTPITGLPITCIDVGYDAAGLPIVLIGTRYVGVTHPVSGDEIVGSVYYIADETFSATWTDLNLGCYTCCVPATAVGCYDVYSVAAAPGFDTVSKVYVVITAPLTSITFPAATAASLEIRAGDNGAQFNYVSTGVTGFTAGFTDNNPAGSVTLAPASPNSVLTVTKDNTDADGGTVTIAVTDGTISWRLVSAAGTATFCGGTHMLSTLGTVCAWTHIHELQWNCLWSFEIEHASRMMFPSYYTSEAAIFVGVAAVNDWDASSPDGTLNDYWGEGGDVYRVTDAGLLSDCIDLNIQGFTTGCLGFNHANICSLDLENDQLAAGAWNEYQMQSPTRVYYSADGGWTWAPSKKDPTGEDRTYVLFGGSIVAGTRGCDCAFSLSCGANLGDFFNQISLISMNIEEVLDMTHAPGYVFDSQMMYVLTSADACYGDAFLLTASAGTSAATVVENSGTVSVTVFNENGTTATSISYAAPTFTINFGDAGDVVLVTATANANVTWTQTAPTVTATEVIDCDGDMTVGASGVAFAMDGPTEIRSLLRWDGTWWERVHSSRYYVVASTQATSMFWFTPLYDWVEVSPDFNSTDCLYMANTGFYMARSIDAGCSWAPLTYPCFDRPTISAWIVVDEDTVLASGCTPNNGYVYRTTNHGAQPWSSFMVQNTAKGFACCGVDFDLSLPRAADSDVLLGDACGEVFLSQDLGETWIEIYETTGYGAFAGASDQTYVVFDPGYGTAGDPGENTFYAAAGNDIGRCAYNADALPFKQDWVYICPAAATCETCALYQASGIDAVGDTVLYVADAGGGSDIPSTVTVTGTVEIGCYECAYGGCYGDFTFTNEPVHTTGTISFISGELVSIVGWNLICTTTCVAGETDVCTFTVTGQIDIMGLSSGAVGYIDFTNESPTTFYCDPDLCTCTVDSTCTSIGNVLSAHLLVTAGGGTSAALTGVWRSVNPLDPMPPAFPALVEWEFLAAGALGPHMLLHPMAGATGVYPDDLWVTAASNMLWALDWVGVDSPTDYIWMWDDPLAAPVVLVSPADGALLATSTTVTLEWEDLDAATKYEVKVFEECPECLDPTEMKLFGTFYTTVAGETCIKITGLTAGTKYFWKVRVACNYPQVSKWSELRSFDTALSLVDYCSPKCGAEDITLTPNFSWYAVIGATGYEIEVSTTEDFATVLASGTPTINAWDGIPQLDYSTTYYWRVRAVKDGVYSGWTYCLFSTIAEPEEPPEPVEPVVIEQSEITPTWIWVIIGIGGALTIAVIILIVTTRRVP